MLNLWNYTKLFNIYYNKQLFEDFQIFIEGFISVLQEKNQDVFGGIIEFISYFLLKDHITKCT